MMIGEPFPEFDLSASGGGHLSSAGLLGRRAVLYFYPKDDTPGCTLEAHDFSALLPDFRRAGVEVFGVSPDDEGSHDRFAAKCAIEFPLLSDSQHRLCDALGVWVSRVTPAGIRTGVERSTFVVGPEGAIEHEWRSVRPAGHAVEVLAAITGR